MRGRGDALRDTRTDDPGHCSLLVKRIHPAKSLPTMLKGTTAIKSILHLAFQYYLPTTVPPSCQNGYDIWGKANRRRPKAGD